MAHHRRAAVLAVAAATLCKRQKTSPLLFKSSTKSVFHCCYRWAASYLPLPAAGDRRAAATAVGFQSQMSAAVAAAATKLLHNLLEKKAMILATKRSTIEVLGGKQRLALDRLWYSSSLSVEETFWKSLWQWQHDVLPSPPFSKLLLCNPLTDCWAAPPWTPRMSQNHKATQWMIQLLFQKCLKIK